MIILGTWLHADPIVDVHAKSLMIGTLEAAQFLLDPMRFGKHCRALFVRLPDRHDHHLNRCELRRETQPSIIAMRHHQPTNHARRYTPACVPRKRLGPLFVLKLEIECLREVLTKVVRRSCLQRLVVLHHRFTRIRPQRAGKLFGISFLPRNHRHRHVFLHERAVHAEHLARLDLGFIVRRVRGVSFLPQKFHRTQKQARAHFPSHDVSPLVVEQRQITIALHPLGKHRVDDRLRRRSHHKPLLEHLAAAHRDHRALGGKPLHVLRLLRQKTFRNEEREIRVHMSGCLEHVVQRPLHALPHAVAVRSDHHATSHRRVVCKFGAQYKLVVPVAEILSARWELLVVSHWPVVPVETRIRTLYAHYVGRAPSLAQSTHHPQSRLP